MSGKEPKEPFELPRLEDMIPSEKTIIQDIKINVALSENHDLDDAIKHIVRATINLNAAFLTAQGIVEDLIEIPKEVAYKRIERATLSLWTTLHEIRKKANNTEKQKEEAK